MFLTPFESLAEQFDEPQKCGECSQIIVSDYCYTNDQHFCEECAPAIASRLYAEAAAFAFENCEVAERLPLYDESKRDAPTPEEYADGYREAYTENAFRCMYRHRYSNYDELIRNLDKFDFADRIRYQAIRDRIEELIEQAIVASGGTSTDEWNEEGLRRY